MGIDPGLAITGYGVIEKLPSGQVKAIDYGAIKTPKEMPPSARLALINDCLAELLKKFNPDEIAFERLFFAKNTATAFDVAQARGVLINCAAGRCKRLFQYTPLQVKMALTGTGRAQKNQVQYMVQMTLGLKEVPRPDDAADALAIAITHAQTNDLNGSNML